MTPTAERLVERYLRGEATAEDERALAQEALQDEDLFDLLTTIGLGRLALLDEESSSIAIADAPPMSVSVPWWRRRLVAAAAAAAILVAMAVGLGRLVLDAPRPSGAPSNSSGSSPRTAMPPPAVAEVRLPAFLATNLEMPAISRSSAVFRAGGPTRQMPNPGGRVRSPEAGMAMVDLGTLDGLAEGAVLVVEADAPAKLAASTAVVVTVFREEARVRVGNDVREGRLVKVDTTRHLQALSTVLADAARNGDIDLLRTAASRASAVARVESARSDARRQVLGQLAALARSRSDVAATVQYLQELEALAGTPPSATPAEHAEILNALATAVAGGGNLADAERLLLQARSLASSSAAIMAQILNNLGAVAALRGDRQTARDHYLSALTLLKEPADQARRTVVESNFAMVDGQR